MKGARIFGWKSAKKNWIRTIFHTIKCQYAVKKTNKRFDVWTSDGMKRYNEITGLVKSDQNMNKNVEI